MHGYLSPSIVALVNVVMGLVISERIRLSMPALLVKLMPQSLVPNNDVGFRRFRTHMKAAMDSQQVLTVTMSIVAMGISFVGVYCVAIRLGVNVSFLYLSTCYRIAALVSLLPISFGGLGTREAVFGNMLA